MSERTSYFDHMQDDATADDWHRELMALVDNYRDAVHAPDSKGAPRAFLYALICEAWQEYARAQWEEFSRTLDTA
jgi:hypothetical protein